jgi:hypothetical protein
LEMYSFHSNTQTTYGSYEGFSFRALSIFTESFPFGALTGIPCAFEPLVGFSFSSFDHSCDRLALALESGDFLSGWPPSCERARGVCGGVVLTRDSVAASEVSLLDSRKDLEIGSLLEVLVLVGVGDRELFCAGGCEVVDGLEICAASTGFVVRLEIGRD